MTVLYVYFIFQKPVSTLKAKSHIRNWTATTQHGRFVSDPSRPED